LDVPPSVDLGGVDLRPALKEASPPQDHALPRGELHAFVDYPLFAMNPPTELVNSGAIFQQW
jgi:hypothetical protein